jgi:uncharacterized surface protein with fasciclin (FAS1) repeats
MKLTAIIFSALAMAFATNISAQCHSKATAQAVSAEQSSNIVEIAASLDDFSTLVTAVKAAGLVETLSGEGPFTVFAPTNDAFNKLPEGTISTLLKPENKEQLKKILTYHVIAGELMAKDVAAAIKNGGGKAVVETVSGGQLTAMVSDGNVMLMDENGNKATVVKTDVDASNGVIHVIDTVVLPK